MLNQERSSVDISSGQMNYLKQELVGQVVQCKQLTVTVVLLQQGELYRRKEITKAEISTAAVNQGMNNVDTSSGLMRYKVVMVLHHLLTGEVEVEVGVVLEVTRGDPVEMEVVGRRSRGSVACVRDQDIQGISVL